MTVRQIAWFVAGYVATVALMVWFNLAVLCEGAAKFDGGCGGFAMYIPLWELFLTPLLLAAILLEQWRKSEAPPTVRLLAYLMGVAVVTEVGWLLIDRFPALLATQALAIGIAFLIRARATISRRKV